MIQNQLEFRQRFYKVIIFKKKIFEKCGVYVYCL